jgi:hypothetical protein
VVALALQLETDHFGHEGIGFGQKIQVRASHDVSFLACCVGVERAGASEGRAIDLARVSGCERDRLTVAKTPQANHHTADWTAG